MIRFESKQFARHFCVLKNFTNEFNNINNKKALRIGWANVSIPVNNGKKAIFSERDISGESA